MFLYQKYYQSNIILASLAEIAVGALIGGTLGKLSDLMRQDETQTNMTTGAAIGMFVGALVQLRKL
jgi:hypothetical protein